MRQCLANRIETRHSGRSCCAFPSESRVVGYSELIGEALINEITGQAKNPHRDRECENATTVSVTAFKSNDPENFYVSGRTGARCGSKRRSSHAN